MTHHHYTTTTMDYIWSDKHKYELWRDIEAKWATKTGNQVCSEIGFLPINDEALIRISEIEAKTKHDVAAFVEYLCEKYPKHAHLIHHKLTSSDVVDTALSMRIKASLYAIRAGTSSVIDVIRNKSNDYGNTRIMARTHGQFAMASNLRHKFGTWSRSIIECHTSCPTTFYGKLSGPIGCASTEAEKLVLNELELLVWKPASQVVDRLCYVDHIVWCAKVTGTIARISRDVWELCRSDVGEMSEKFYEEQVGSSSMPTKRNPIGFEQMWGLARVVRSNVQVVLENIELIQERDISNSSAERIIIPQTMMITDYMVQKFRGLVDGLVINQDVMEAHVDSATSDKATKSFNDMVESGISRPVAHKTISNI